MFSACVLDVQVVTDDLGIKIEKLELDHLGSAKKNGFGHCLHNLRQPLQIDLLAKLLIRVPSLCMALKLEENKYVKKSVKILVMEKNHGVMEKSWKKNLCSGPPWVPRMQTCAHARIHTHTHIRACGTHMDVRSQGEAAGAPGQAVRWRGCVEDWRR
eukprot:502215-Pelagomonas_calceolata.AAC.1